MQAGVCQDKITFSAQFGHVMQIIWNSNIWVGSSHPIILCQHAEDIYETLSHLAAGFEFILKIFDEPKFVSPSALLTKTKSCGWMAAAFISGTGAHQYRVSTFGKFLHTFALSARFYCVYLSEHSHSLSLGRPHVFPWSHTLYFPSANIWPRARREI